MIHSKRFLVSSKRFLAAYLLNVEASSTQEALEVGLNTRCNFYNARQQ